MISRLSLFDWWVQRDNEEHLPAILVRQQEETENCGHWDFVVKCFTVKLEKGLENLDVVATTRCEALNLFEDRNSIPRDRDNGRFVHHLLVESVYWISLGRVRYRNVETHLHKGDRSIVILVELQSNFIFS